MSCFWKAVRQLFWGNSLDTPSPVMHWQKVLFNAHFFLRGSADFLAQLPHLTPGPCPPSTGPWQRPEGNPSVRWEAYFKSLFFKHSSALHLLSQTNVDFKWTHTHTSEFRALNMKCAGPKNKILFDSWDRKGVAWCIEADWVPRGPCFANGATPSGSLQSWE